VRKTKNTKGVIDGKGEHGPKSGPNPKERKPGTGCNLLSGLGRNWEKRSWEDRQVWYPLRDTEKQSDQNKTNEPT